MHSHDLFSCFDVGCVGGVCGLGNVLGRELCDLERLFNDGKLQEAKELQHRIVAPNACVSCITHI